MFNPSDIAFSPTVKAVQEQKGSRRGYLKMQMADRITDELKAFIETRDSAYLATSSADGQPYVQHRGGPPGFLRVLDDRRIAFADFRGNRQYISTGNLSDNPKAFLFLMDYANQRRIKLWGEARVVDDGPALLDQLTPADYRARPEQVMVFEVKAWDANCPQHIPLKFGADQVAAALAVKDAKISELEAELATFEGASA